MARLFVAYEEQGEQSPVAGAGDALLDIQARAQEQRDKEEERRQTDRQLAIGERRNELDAEGLKIRKAQDIREEKYRANRDLIEDERYRAETERQKQLDADAKKLAEDSLKLEQDDLKFRQDQLRKEDEEEAEKEAEASAELERARKVHGVTIDAAQTRLEEEYGRTPEHLRPPRSWVDERKGGIESQIQQYNAATTAEEAARLARSIGQLQAEALEDYQTYVDNERLEIVNEDLGDLLAIAQDPDLRIPSRDIAKARDARTPQQQRDNLRVLVEEWRGWRAMEREWQEQAPTFSRYTGPTGIRPPAGEPKPIQLARENYWKVMGDENSPVGDKTQATRHFLQVLAANGDELQMMQEGLRIDRAVQEERIARMEEQAFFADIFASTAPSLNTTFLAAGALADPEFYPEAGTPEYAEFQQHAPAANLVLTTIEETFGDSAAAVPESDVMRALAKKVNRTEGDEVGGVTKEELKAFFAYINDNRVNAQHPLWASVQDVDTSIDGPPERRWEGSESQGESEREKKQRRKEKEGNDD